MEDSLLILSTVYENVVKNTSINDCYNTLLKFDNDLPLKIINFINVFMEDEKRKLKNRYKKNGEILVYLNELTESINKKENIELAYLRAIKVYPKLKNNLIDYIKYLMQKEIDKKHEEIKKSIHPELRGEFYGRK